MQPEVVEFSQLQNDGEYTDNYLQPQKTLQLLTIMMTVKTIEILF